MISSIRLQNFRSYRDGSFEFDPGVNIIVGPNASGKTNLLEAVLVSAQGKSYRGREVELLRFNAPWLRLEAVYGGTSRVYKLLPTDGQIDRVYEIAGQKYKRLSLERSLPFVLFEPNHLQLLSRGPEQRRQYFDDVLERTKPGFKRLSASYRRALAQRNALLKQKPESANKQLFAWDVRLGELGAQIVEARLELIEQFNKSLSRIYSKISGRRSKVELSYDTSLPLANYSSALLSRLETNIRSDFARGFTGYGPHREDIVITLNGKPAAGIASRGELRSILLAFKIIELELVEAARGAKPIFLLDDVFSELDSARRRHLIDYLKNYQSLITTTDADSVIEYFTNQRLIALG